MSDIQQFPFPPFLLPTLLPSVSFRLLSILFPPPVAHRAAVGSSSGFHFLGPAFGLQAVVDLILVDSEKPAFSPFKTNTREKKRLQVREFKRIKTSVMDYVFQMRFVELNQMLATNGPPIK